MTALLSKTFLLIVQCVVTSGLNSSVRVEYVPGGPGLCIRLCQEESVFYPLLREFRCRQVPVKIPNSTKRHSTQNLFICLKKYKKINTSTSSTSNCISNEEGYASLKHLGDGTLDPLLALSKPKISIGDLKTNPDKVLYEACEKGNLCIVQYILSQSLADINVKGKLGRTPVMAAARNGQVAVFDFLVSQGCDLSAVDVNNNTVLHLACKEGIFDIVRKLVVDRKYDTSIKGFNGWTPLTLSVFYGHINVFDLLVSTGSDPKEVRYRRKNILHLACLGGHVDMIKHIVSLHIFDLESIGGHGKTALLYAVRNSFVEAVEFLVNKGCNPRVVSSERNNILHTACSGGKLKIVKYVIKLNVVSMESRGLNGETPLMKAAVMGHRKVFDFLLTKGCKLMAVDDFGERVIHVACEYGFAEIVRRILLFDIVNMELKDYRGRTPVIISAKKGHIKVVKLLVGKGCSLKAVDDKGNNVLHAACISGHVDVVKYLLKLRVVERNAVNKHGRTPLQEAQIKGHKRIVALFKTKI